MKRINYKQISFLDPDWIKNQIKRFILEDAPDGDLTSQGIIDESLEISAKMIAADNFIFCGQNIIPYCFPSSCQIKVLFKDGNQIFEDDTIAIIKGPALEILTYERVMLNLIQRLCGISTETKKYTQLKTPNSFKVMDTRKMTPGLRKFEKYAVYVGGGWNHRLDLSSGILIKDNHLMAAGGIEFAIKQMSLSNKRKLPIELEVDTIDQLTAGLKLDLDGFLLDNMNPLMVKKAVKIIRKQPQGNNIFVEASGGINYETLEAYAATGVDGVSMSAITTQAPVVDIKLDFT